MSVFHPSPSKLDAFTDAGTSQEDLRRIASHLESCQRCRNEVAFLRELRQHAARLPNPELPNGILERVLHDRARGQRVILPTDHPRKSSEKRRIYPIAAALLIVAAGLTVYLSRTPTLQKGDRRPSVDAGEPGLG